MSNLPDFKEEKRLWKKGCQLIIGVDEVGRGAFAGPVVAGAVAFTGCHPERSEGSHKRFFGLRPQNDNTIKFQNDNEIKIDDSKRLKPLERKRAALWIKENCLSWGIGEVGVRVINRLGIGKATEHAMRRAIAKLLNGYIAKKENNETMEQSNNCFVLVDAFHIKYLKGAVRLKNHPSTSPPKADGAGCPVPSYALVLGQKAIKKGDQKSISIAASSILAKVYRDSLMQRLTKRYREYHWGRNKGYGTKKHQEAILKNGSTTLHRTQFIQTFIANYEQKRSKTYFCS